jgi:hypothetical protein
MTCQTSLMTLIWLLKSLKRMKPYIFQVTVVVFFGGCGCVFVGEEAWESGRGKVLKIFVNE